MRSATKPLALAQENNRIVRLAKPASILGDGFQHRLNICRRSSDHTEDLACRGLLLKCLGQVAGTPAQLVKQPRVLDGDDGLGGEIGQQRDLLVAEGTNLLVVYDDRTDQLIFFLEHGNGEDAAVAGELHVGNHPRVTLDIGALLHEVGDIDHLAFGGDQTQPAVRMRPEYAFAASLFNPGSRGVVLRGQTKGLAVAEIHRSEFRLADSHCVFQQGSVHRPEVPRRTGDDAQYLGGRGLLLQRFAQLVEQAGVLNSNDGLGGKVLHQLDLLIGEGPDFLAVDSNRTEQIIFPQHWHYEQ